ncbi:hypothetical protein L6452_05127 [Arctium lappa]|uniref:Uncharacterized protein n=1 Tax=Arctium lappa TaxID=4217 RepID=A0ACB9EGL2_ARCLA|nr:hypothetical protein L6452_05127 [Arctium lappa]
MSPDDEDGEFLTMNKSSKSESTGSRSITKKNKVIWTPDLHNKFLEAIAILGVDRAVPTKIIDLMKVDGLTRDHIASHLQKYRIFSKKIAEASYRDQIALQPVLLESSINNIGVCPTPVQKSWLSYCEINPPILDTSSFSFPILEASSSTTVNPSKLANSPSLPNQKVKNGSSMQESEILEHTMPDSLDGQGYLIDDGAELGIANSGSVVNSSNSPFMQNLDGVIYDYGVPSTDIEMISSNDLHSYMELPMNCSTNTASSSYTQNSNGFESSKLVEMNSLYDSNSNKELLSSWNDEMEMNTDLEANLEIRLGEDDLMLDEADIATLWETFIPEEPYVDHHGKHGSTSNNPNPPAFLEPPNQDMNGENFPNIVSIDSNYNENHQLMNEETTAIDMQQCLDGYLPGFDPTYDMYDIDEQLLELESRPEPVEEDTTLQDLFWNPFDQD